MNDQPDTLDVISHDAIDPRRQEVLRLFPDVRTEGGKIDFDRLKLALGEMVDTGRERYGMTWPGKADCFRAIQTPSLGTLRPCPEESVNFDTTENLIIEGDNLEVLKLLQKSYLGKVKMIYIDPPYNTGNDFIYPDNFSESLQTYLEYTGQVDAEGRKFGTNTETDGRFHSKWMNMMYPRLYLARNLLREDGVIFVSIDDHEVTNARRVLEEIFGEDCFVAQFIWKKMDSPSRNAEDRAVSEYHEYVLAYARNREHAALRPQQRTDILEDYPLTAPDGRKARRRQLRKNGKSARREDRPTMWYPLTAPDGTEIWPIAPEGWDGRWGLARESWMERVEAGETEWIQREYGWVPYVLEFAPELPQAPWATLWDDLDQNRQAKAELTSIMGSEVPFQTPKPTSLIERMLSVSVAPDEIVLDFFAGSGTTAHACLATNAVDGGTRRFILVQLPEPTNRTDYPTIADITKERVRRVIKRLNDEDAGKLDLNDTAKQDRGFRVFKLAESNFTPWDADAPPDAGALAKQLELHVAHVRDGRTPSDLLYEILLKSGIPISGHIETLTLAERPVHAADGGKFLICLETPLTLDLVRAMAGRKPQRVVCLDAGFADNDQLKANAVQIFRAAGVTSFKTV